MRGGGAPRVSRFPRANVSRLNKGCTGETVISDRAVAEDRMILWTDSCCGQEGQDGCYKQERALTAGNGFIPRVEDDQYLELKDAWNRVSSLLPGTPVCSCLMMCKRCRAPQLDNMWMLSTGVRIS